jgi:outer membrane protein
MRNNVGKYISLNLSVPIFNHLQVYNNVRLAKLDLQTARFKRDPTKCFAVGDVQCGF